MSVKFIDEESTGNSEQDWEIFDVLCKDPVEQAACTDHTPHTLDLLTTLRSELAASNYKKDRMINEITEVKSNLCARDAECEQLRAQTARQSTLIGSLQTRLQATEHRERNSQARNETTTHSLQREKRCLEEKNQEFIAKIRRLEGELVTEESLRDQTRVQLQDLIRRLCLCLGIDVCDAAHLTPETVVTKAGEVVAELQRLRNKLSSTCESLHTCETDLLNTKTVSCSEKQSLQLQIENQKSILIETENRYRQAERDLQLTRDRLSECEVNGNKLREELRGFESRCSRLQNTLDRFQNDRLQFLRNLATMICVTEPCETLIKDKLRDIVAENQNQHTQLVNMREQFSTEAVRHRETVEANNCRLRAEEAQKLTIEERFDKAQQELQHLKAEHFTLADFLVRLSRALNWGECTEPPGPGACTSTLAETLLERIERLAIHSDNHHHHHHSAGLKLRRERSCHDLPLKEVQIPAMHTLQRRVRVLRDQVQRRDLQLELLRRKLTLLEDTARGKCIVQNERDEAIHRAKRTSKCAEKTAHELCEAKSQLADAKAQLIDAADYKLTSLERARKIDELQSRLIDYENEKARLCTQLASYKARARSAVESSSDRFRRDEQTIHNLREEMTRLKSQLADINHRLSQLQTFRSSVARLLHLRDVPHAGILQRLQTLCHAHQEFTLLSRRYESASPIVDHPCPRFDDLIPPSVHCRPLSSSPGHLRRFEDSGLDDHYDDEFDYSKKF